MIPSIFTLPAEHTKKDETNEETINQNKKELGEIILRTDTLLQKERIFTDDVRWNCERGNDAACKIFPTLYVQTKNTEEILSDLVKLNLNDKP